MDNVNEEVIEAEVEEPKEASEQQLDILALADELEAEITAEENLKFNRVVAELHVRFKLIKKTGIRTQLLSDKVELLKDFDKEDFSVEQGSQLTFELCEIILGENRAAEVLASYDGEKIVFMSLFRELWQLQDVKKA